MTALEICNYNASCSAGNKERFDCWNNVSNVHDSIMNEFDIIDDFSLNKASETSVLLIDNDDDDDVDDGFWNHSSSSNDEDEDNDHGHHDKSFSVVEDDAELLFLWNASPSIGVLNDEIPETSTTSSDTNDFLFLTKESSLTFTESITSGSSRVDLPDIVDRSPSPSLFHGFVDCDDTRESRKRKDTHETSYYMPHEILDYRSVTPEHRSSRSLTSLNSNASDNDADLDSSTTSSTGSYENYMDYASYINDDEQFKEKYSHTLRNLIYSMKRTKTSRNMIKRQKLLVPISSNKITNAVENKTTKKKQQQRRHLFHSQNDEILEKSRNSLLQTLLSTHFEVDNDNFL